MDSRSFYFIFKNMLFFIYCTEHLFDLEDVILSEKQKKSILKWYGGTVLYAFVSEHLE